MKVDLSHPNHISYLWHMYESWGVWDSQIIPREGVGHWQLRAKFRVSESCLQRIVLLLSIATQYNTVGSSKKSVFELTLPSPYMLHASSPNHVWFLYTLLIISSCSHIYLLNLLWEVLIGFFQCHLEPVGALGEKRHQKWLKLLFEAGKSELRWSENTQGINCITHRLGSSYLHPSLSGKEEDALALFPQAASPLWEELRIRVQFKRMLSVISYTYVIKHKHFQSKSELWPACREIVHVSGDAIHHF